MKNISKIVLSIAVACFGFLNASAQDDIAAKKTARPLGNGQYELTLETFVKAAHTEIEVESATPTDIVLILDVSGSMTSNNVTRYTGVYNDTGFNLSNFHRAYNNTSNLFLDVNGKRYPFTLSRVYYGEIGTGNGRYYYDYLGTVQIGGNTYTGKIRANGNNNSSTVNLRDYDSILSALDETNAQNVKVVRGATESVTRLVALQDAVKNFVASIYANSQSTAVKVTHRISIVRFSGETNNTTEAQRKYMDFTNVGSNYANVFNTKIDQIGSGGGTYANEGFATAKNVMTGARNTQTVQINGQEVELEVAKVVVFFTDGTPGANGWNNNNYTYNGKQVAYHAINTAHEMKQDGVTIFSVTVESFDPSDDKHKYLSLLTSAYPDATSESSDNWASSYPNPQTDQVIARDREYFSIATDAEALDAVFQNISNSIDNPVNVSLNASTQIQDYVSQDFMLPVGMENASIKVYTQDFIRIDGDSSNDDDYVFDSELKDFDASIEYETVTVAEIVNGETKNVQQQKITVSNFDFEDHWCGADDQSSTGWTTNGQKLVIKIVVEENPDGEGGLVTTNGTKSGIYSSDGTSIIKPIHVNPATVFADRALKISKKMDHGESAIVVVRNVETGDEWTVMLASEDPENPGYLFATVKVPVQDSDKNFYHYVIAEKNDWTWDYEDSDAFGTDAQGVTLYTVTGTDAQGNPTYSSNFDFDFTTQNNSKNLDVLNGAATVVNNFKYNGPVTQETSE